MTRVSALLILMLLSGCLPSSCSRPDTHSLLPSDSLSRAIAIETPESALEFTGQVDLDLHIEHPRTILHDASSQKTYVSDTRSHRIVSIDRDGAVRNVTALAGVEHLFLAGIRNRHVAILEPAAPRLHFLKGDSLSDSIDVDLELSESSLIYAAVSDHAAFIKIVDAGESSVIYRVDDDGKVTGEYELPGPHWRHAGLMRFWDDTLISLSGYRPVIDRISPGGIVDSLVLQGFDSPMLSRSRRFVEGSISDAPLLTSSADVESDYLFVLNLRAGWIRVDVYDQTGRLQHVLVEPDPQPRRQFYPVDLTVTAVPSGGFEIRVLLVEPAPAVLKYRIGPDFRSSPRSP